MASRSSGLSTTGNDESATATADKEAGDNEICVPPASAVMGTHPGLSRIEEDRRAKVQALPTNSSNTRSPGKPKSSADKKNTDKKMKNSHPPSQVPGASAISGGANKEEVNNHGLTRTEQDLQAKGFLRPSQNDDTHSTATTFSANKRTERKGKNSLSTVPGASPISGVANKESDNHSAGGGLTRTEQDLQAKGFRPSQNATAELQPAAKGAGTVVMNSHSTGDPPRYVAHGRGLAKNQEPRVRRPNDDGRDHNQINDNMATDDDDGALDNDEENPQMENPVSHEDRPTSLPVVNNGAPTIMAADQNEGLVEARMVTGEPSSNAFLPEALQVDPAKLEHEAEKEQKETQCRRIGYCLIMGACAILALSLGIGLGIREDATFAPTVAPSTSPTGVPSSAPTGLLDLLKMNLPNYTLESLKTYGTPQSEALEWLSNHYNITSYPEWRKKQLFALATFYHAFEGPNWRQPIRERWMDYNKTECLWFSSGFGLISAFDETYDELPKEIQVKPCTDDGRFMSLDLSNLFSTGEQQLKPSLPPELALLTSLSIMDLTIQRTGLQAFSSLLPTQLYQLTNLTVLKLAGMNGTIPSELAHFSSNLETLDLSANALTGSIPTEFGLMTALTKLSLQLNRLTGPIPTELGSMASLQTLDLGGIPLAGSIPSQIGQITALERLVMGRSTLTGFIPTDFGMLTILEVLDLDQTSMSGSLPSELGLMTSMTSLYLHNNSIDGSLPSELGLMTNLEILELGENDFSGSLPSEIGLMASITQLSLYENSFTNFLPSELGLLTQLYSIDLSGNIFSGSIPIEFGFLANLGQLHLDRNSLSGPIPWSLSFLPNLVEIRMSENSLTGSLPNDVFLWSGVEVLSLYMNSLNGSLPSEIASMPSLRILELDGNSLSGSLPSEIGLPTNMSDIWLNGNTFSGSLPSEIGLLTGVEVLSLYMNSLNGSLPIEVASMPSLRILDLDGNSLSGNVPSEIGLPTNMSEIWLNGNTFSGSLPSEIGLLTALVWLDLSQLPLLTGSIPLELVDTALGVLNVSGSPQLSGTIPEELCHLGNETCTYFGPDYFPRDCSLDFDCTNLLCGCECSCSDQ